MKAAAEIAKVVQVGAAAMLLLAPMFMGMYGQREALVVWVFLLGSIAFALVCPVVLWLAGERQRAWKGFLVKVILTLVGSALSAPMVIR
jgi:hypothetical protein